MHCISLPPLFFGEGAGNGVRVCGKGRLRVRVCMWGREKIGNPFVVVAFFGLASLLLILSSTRLITTTLVSHASTEAYHMIDTCEPTICSW